MKEMVEISRVVVYNKLVIYCHEKETISERALFGGKKYFFRKTGQTC